MHYAHQQSTHGRLPLPWLCGTIAIFAIATARMAEPVDARDLKSRGV